MGMYKQWAEEITTIVESNPAVRDCLRELIKALAEQDEAYRANEAASPFDDPCDMLTYRIPGTILTRLDAREDVDLTVLPGLGSDEVERQRQAIMLVGIHDHSAPVKISDGIWPPELLDRVWQRLQSDPPNGPCDTVINKALAWLDGLARQATKVAGRNDARVALQPELENYIFRRTGDYWQLRFRGNDVVDGVMDRDGMTYIHHLIGRPGTDVGCLELYRRRHPENGTRRHESPEREDEGFEGRSVDGPHVDDITDNAEKEKAVWFQGIKEKQAELEKAENDRDFAAKDRIKGELEKLRAEAAGTIRLQGSGQASSRSFATEAKRCSNTVSKRLHEAIDHIRTHSGPLADYLEKSISTGMTCKYTPVQVDGEDGKIAWSL